LKSDPTEVRYPGVQGKVQEYLRRRGDGHVTTSDVTANVEANRTTLASVMAVLARTSDTGVSHVSAGLYRYTRALDKEYVARMKRDGIDVPQPGAVTSDPALKVSHPVRPTPAVIPQKRTHPGEPVVVVSARDAHLEVPAETPAPLGLTKGGTPRQRRPMQRDIGVRTLRFLQLPENKGEIFSITEVAEAIGSLHSSVSHALRVQADSPDFPVRRIMPGTLYTVPLSAAEEAERDRDVQPAAGESPPAATPESVQPEPVQPEPVQPAPEPVQPPEPSPADDNMLLLEKLAETAPGKWLTQDAEGQIFWLEKLR
jgi:hypothetical protein